MSQPHQSEEATMKTVGGETASKANVGSSDKGAESLSTLHEHEQRAILTNPEGIWLLMNWHDYQQSCADAMGMGCHGNQRRYDQLKAHGKAIVEADPEIWSDDVLRAFGVTRKDSPPSGA